MLNDSHLSIASANDVNEICQPLFINSTITHFEFMRLFPDGSCIWLASNGNFVKKLSGADWSPSEKEHIKTTTVVGKRYCLWNNRELQLCHRRLLISREFNIDHGLLVKESYTSYQDYFGFATQATNFEIYSFYFNHIDLIDQFIFYFKDKAALLIRQATAQKIYFHGAEALQDKFMLSIADAQVPHKNLVIRKYRFTLADKVISLSAQELNSIKLIARGYTLKEAGQYLNLSPRTVEYYIKCAREKLNVKTSRHLISIYWQSTLARLD